MEVALLGLGPAALWALDASRMIADRVACGVWDARFAHPIDEDLIERLVRAGVAIVTIEEHAPAGGFGEAVASCCLRRGLSEARLTRLSMPDRFIAHDSRAAQVRACGLDAQAIADAALACVGQSLTEEA